VLIYKILLPAEWADFEAEGRFDGSADDLRDGFIHCSSREQVGATARRFFSAEPELFLAVIDSGSLGDAVRWEPASNGELFPHVYMPLPISAVIGVHRVEGASKLDDIL